MSPISQLAHGYKWDPIDKEAEIRLLTIQPARRKRWPLQCNMTIIRRDSASAYEALSYTWGDPTNPEIIQCNGKDVRVTKNCANALRDLLRRSATSFRDLPVPGYIWIDSICINQEDVAERNSQVAIMGEIFHCARRTVVYLGESDMDAKWMEQHVLRDAERNPWFTSVESISKQALECVLRPVMVY